MDMHTQWAKLHHPHVLRPAEAVAVPHGTTAGGTRHWGSTPNKAETYCLGVGLWHRNRRWLDICIARMADLRPQQRICYGYFGIATFGELDFFSAILWLRI